MMGASRESTLWIWLNRTKPLYKRTLHMCRVENSALNGMADVEGCLKSKQFWIELKCYARPSNSSTKIKARFEEAQIPWLKRRHDAGGNVFILLQVGQGHKARRYLIPGDLGAILEKGLTETRLEALAIIGPKSTASQIVEAAAQYIGF